MFYVIVHSQPASYTYLDIYIVHVFLPCSLLVHFLVNMTMMMEQKKIVEHSL